MKRIPVIILLLGSSFLSKGQCNLTSLSNQSKDSLLIFWKILKEAQQQKDSTRLLSLIDFPFNVAQRIFSGKPSRDNNFYQLDAGNYMQYADMIFFEKHFEAAVSSCDDPTGCFLFHGRFRRKGKKECGYLFCYNFKNDAGKDEERCFSITRLGGSYKLESHWIKYSL